MLNVLSGCQPKNNVAVRAYKLDIASLMDLGMYRAENDGLRSRPGLYAEGFDGKYKVEPKQGEKRKV